VISINEDCVQLTLTQLTKRKVADKPRKPIYVNLTERAPQLAAFLRAYQPYAAKMQPDTTSPYLLCTSRTKEPLSSSHLSTLLNHTFYTQAHLHVEFTFTLSEVEWQVLARCIEIGERGAAIVLRLARHDVGERLRGEFLSSRGHSRTDGLGGLLGLFGVPMHVRGCTAAMAGLV
jgi:hypothetical protein